MSIKRYKEPEFMKELHKIRADIYKETKKLTFKEKIEKTHMEVKEFLGNQGYRLIPFNKGYKIVSIK